MNLAGESAEQGAPEGATAPETLREPDREGMNTLESAQRPKKRFLGRASPPTE
jgi:hypothetical protein